MASGTNLGKAYVQIIPSAEGISGSISNVIQPEAMSAGKSAGINIAGGISSALKGAVTTVAAGTAALTGAIVKGTSDVAAYGDNIDKMSQKMGMSAQAYQEWDAVMQHSGTSMETMKASMKTLANAAETGSAAFDALGISQEQIASMSQEQLFESTITALQNVEDETERTYLAGKTLGRGATELGALLNTSAEDTQAMRDRVRELGGVMSDEAVKASAAFQDNMQDLQTAVAGLGRNMLSTLLPSMNQIISGFTSLATGEEGASEQIMAGFSSLFTDLEGIVNGIIDTAKEMLPGLLEGIGEVLPDLITMATDLIISLATAIIDAAPMLITTIIPALATAAIEIVTALGQALIEAAPSLLDAGIELFNMLKESFAGNNLMEVGVQTVQSVLDGVTSALPGLLSTGVEILTNLTNGILEGLPGFIETAGTVIVQFADFLLTNLPTILSAGVQLILNLIRGIVQSLPKIVEASQKVMLQLVTTLLQHLPEILRTGISLVGELISGIVSMLPEIAAAALQMANNYIDMVMSVDWLGLGVDIIAGIIDGIKSMADAFLEAIVKLCSGALDAVKKFFGISSPSKVMADEVGRYIPEGIAMGIEQYSGAVTDAMDDLKTDALEAAQMDINASGNFSVSDNNAVLARMDLMISLMTKYFPELEKQIPEGYTFNAINRQLGTALV